MVKVVTEKDKKKLCAAIMMIALSQIKCRKKRTRWTREWLSLRKKMGCYENLMKELALQDAEGYRGWIRMDTHTFQYLLDKVTPLIVKRNTIMREAIPPGERLAVTLRYLATGETQSSLAYNFRIAQNTISGILPEVCKAIFEVLKKEYLSTPHNESEWRTISQQFLEKWNFPLCIGAMDGKHVRITPPPGSGSSFYNYKGDFSIVLLGLVDADLKFLYVDVGTNGRISDGGVWAKSSLKKALDANSLCIPDHDVLPSTDVKVPFVIVADDAFPLTNNIMKPYSGGGLDLNKIIFNYRLSRARRVSENAFGILAARFRIFHSQIPVSVAKCKLFVLAACVLHNLLRSKAPKSYTPIGSIDYEDINNCQIVPGDWRNEETGWCGLRKQGHKTALSAKEIQKKFCDYFNSIGAVSWQKEFCKFH